MSNNNYPFEIIDQKGVMMDLASGFSKQLQIALHRAQRITR